MKEAYLEVTFRKGRPLAAYYYLPRDSRQKSVRTECLDSGLLVDRDRNGCPIGIEILHPGKGSAAALNRALVALGLPSVDRQELRPLRAA